MTGCMFTSLNVVSIAAVDCDWTSRSAMRARKRDIGTRCSGRSPSPPRSTGGAAGRKAAAGAVGAAGAFAAGAPWIASSTSPLVTRPPRPLPLKPAGSILLSAAIRCAAGMIAGAAPRLAGAGADVAAGAGAAAGAAAVAVFASVSMVAIISLPTTVPPSPFMILTSTPESGAGVSRTTLSVSMSTRFSSRLTKSPTLRCHDTSVASATDSESCGTFTSTSMLAPGGAALDGLHRAVGARRRAHSQREIDELLLLLFVQRLVAGGRRRPRIAARINKLLVRQQMPQEVMLDAMPGALIARLFLAPHDFGCVLVLFDLHLERVVRERIQLGNADQRNIGNAAFAPPRAQ